MYKLLIVDDEEIEREGMAEFIPWQEYNVELVGTARNGAEGFEKIQEFQPDIVLTDIKMPVMDGIALIHKTREVYPDIEFIVLSGYGEFEYTSRAMEEGIRHYILKPCDEEKIVEVLEKVKLVMKEKQSRKEEVSRYNTTIRSLLPRAREQVFSNMLLGREQVQEDYRLLMNELELENAKMQLLVFGFEEEIDYLEQFILGNMLDELLGEGSVILSTAVDESIYFLIYQTDFTVVEGAVQRTKQEFNRRIDKPFYTALSKCGMIHEIRELYVQLEELLWIGEVEKWNGLLCHEKIKAEKTDALKLIDYHTLQNAKEWDAILFELYLLFCKMQYRQYTVTQKREVCGWIQKLLNEGESVVLPEELKETNELFRFLAQEVLSKNVHVKMDNKEMQRFQNILTEIFLHLSSKELSIRYLAKEILFMNEDYFGRLFLKHKKIKFSTYVLEQRIQIAKRMMEYSEEIKVGQVVELIGFPEDGQYFSKVFKKLTGIAPSEYTESLKK